MKSLFVRIFVSYWIAQALFFMLAFAVATALRPSREIANLEVELPRFFHETLQAYQSGGESGSWRYLRSLHESHHVRVYIFDAQGKDLLGRTPPEWIERARRGQLASAESFWARFRGPQFLRTVQTADGQQYTMIMELMPTRVRADRSGFAGPVTRGGACRSRAAVSADAASGVSATTAAASASGIARQKPCISPP